MNSRQQERPRAGQRTLESYYAAPGSRREAQHAKQTQQQQQERQEQRQAAGRGGGGGGSGGSPDSGGERGGCAASREAGVFEGDDDVSDADDAELSLGDWVVDSQGQQVELSLGEWAQHQQQQGSRLRRQQQKQQQEQQQLEKDREQEEEQEEQQQQNEEQEVQQPWEQPGVSIDTRTAAAVATAGSTAGQPACSRGGVGNIGCQWACPACTYAGNAPGATFCGVCGGFRSMPGGKAAQQQQPSSLPARADGLLRYLQPRREPLAVSPSDAVPGGGTLLEEEAHGGGSGGGGGDGDGGGTSGLVCQECGRVVPDAAWQEHSDRHLALRLQRQDDQEQAAAVAADDDDGDAPAAPAAATAAAAAAAGGGRPPAKRARTEPAPARAGRVRTLEAFLPKK